MSQNFSQQSSQDSVASHASSKLPLEFSQANVTKFMKKFKNILFDDDDEEDEWLRNLSYDSNQHALTMKVDLDFSEEFENATIILPRTFTAYSKGQFIIGDNYHEVKAPSFQGTLKNLFVLLKRLRDEELEKLAPTPTPVMNAQGDPEDPFNDDSDIEETPFMEVDIDFDEDLESAHRQAIREKVEALLRDINKTSGWYSSFGTSGSQQSRIHICINPKPRLAITPFVAQAWGIDFDKYICINLTLGEHFFESHIPMDVDTFQAGNLQEGTSSIFKDNNKSKYGIQWVVNDRASKWIQRFWPFKEKYIKEHHGAAKRNPFIGLLNHVEHVIKNCSKFCSVCGEKMEFEGVKPTVCENKLCIFSSENFALGVDVESQILNEPELSDLHISFAATACNMQGNYNPFKPFPEGVVWRGLDTRTGQRIEKTFIHNGSKDMTLLRSVLNSIPSVDLLGKWIREGKLKENLDKINHLCYPLLRWIFSSNRTFMKCLKEEEKLDTLHTSFQYAMLNSTPEKELKFQALKKKHGSRWMWHGSPASALFSIMRQGLKNMSGTNGQLNGAAHGSGVYGGQNSSISTSYMRFLMGWKHSERFGGHLGCLMLCEIIDLYKPHPYYVIPEQDHIQTRFFFVYTGSTSTNVDASIFPKQLPKIEGFNS
mmetsp:Transcript_5967/g.22649  ORF Transcript_5967/g.22649 Transcript_5967/m.22649 type:complete len:654 (-) Transcript_5967:46-2007(-)|eukprot:CAMPEP_0117441598 /NCGR_PEP_ID=MMETSP0759-20121206/3716_1 /TAXON_ID=63605 /ORGANISM="Percolomonas cosmopolitus, Strain WS" /LENGTH=653 /DNA_ID=CAMNT_0005233455 /DNA_START=329 /DNA_END=2290 /DNA_ORIENTATION=-